MTTAINKLLFTLLHYINKAVLSTQDERLNTRRILNKKLNKNKIYTQDEYITIK